MENLIGFFSFFVWSVIWFIWRWRIFNNYSNFNSFFDLPFKISTTYSLIIVFLVSLFGVLKKKAYSYNFNSIFYLGIFSLIGVLFSRNFLFKIISEKLLLSTFVIFLFLTGIILAIKSNNKILKKNQMLIKLNLFLL